MIQSFNYEKIEENILLIFNFFLIYLNPKTFFQIPFIAKKDKLNLDKNNFVLTNRNMYPDFINSHINAFDYAQFL